MYLLSAEACNRTAPESKTPRTGSSREVPGGRRKPEGAKKLQEAPGSSRPQEAPEMHQKTRQKGTRRRQRSVRREIMRKGAGRGVLD